MRSYLMPLTVLTRQKRFDRDRNNNKSRYRTAALNIPQERSGECLRPPPERSRLTAFGERAAGTSPEQWLNAIHNSA
jgi:hypothetical protein